MVEAKGASVGMTTARLGNRIRYRARQFWRALGFEEHVERLWCELA